MISRKFGGLPRSCLCGAVLVCKDLPRGSGLLSKHQTGRGMGGGMTTTMKGEPTPSDREVLTGLVERVTYQNAENGFCVLRVKARDQRELVTLVGHAAVAEGAQELLGVDGPMPRSRSLRSWSARPIGRGQST
jgi:hypothetical protein